MLVATNACSEESGVWTGSLLRRFSKHSFQECCRLCRDEFEECKFWHFITGECFHFRDVESPRRSGRRDAGIRGVVQELEPNYVISHDPTNQEIVNIPGAFNFTTCPGYDPENLQFTNQYSSYQCSQEYPDCYVNFQIRYEEDFTTIIERDTHFNLDGRVIDEETIDHCEGDIGCPASIFQRHMYRYFEETDPPGFYETRIEITRDGNIDDCFVATAYFEGDQPPACTSHADCVPTKRYCTDKNVCSVDRYVWCPDIEDGLNGECPEESYLLVLRPTS